MEVSPLPWKVQWADHGMGSVTINGIDRLAMFGGKSGGCTRHYRKTFSLKALNNDYTI